MKILVIEDEIDAADSLRSSLEAECFAVDIAPDGEKGSFLGRTGDYDMIILDYILPKKDGKKVCEEIRLDNKKTPIIALSVKSEVETKVDLLNLGADDYMTKPFSFNELLSRIYTILRRPPKIASDIIEIGELRVNLKNHEVTCNCKEAYLTRKEFMLLENLIRNMGKVVSQSGFSRNAYGACLGYEY